MSDQVFQPQRSRSPAYPYLNLQEAVEHAKSFFKKYRNQKVPARIALEDMGYSITSGSGVRVIAALTQFGLFDIEGSKVNRNVWLTELGRSIAWEDPSKPDETLLHLQEAALKPDMHQWVFDTYKLAEASVLPDDRVLDFQLRRDMGFTDKASVAFIKEFRETYEYAKLDNLQHSPQLTAAGFGVDFANLFGVTKTTMSPQPIAQPDPPAIQPTNVDSQEYTTSLTRGKIARLVLPGDMKRKDFQLLAKWLDLLSEAALYEEDDDKQDE